MTLSSVRWLVCTGVSYSLSLCSGVVTGHHVRRWRRQGATVCVYRALSPQFCLSGNSPAVYMVNPAVT